MKIFHCLRNYFPDPVGGTEIYVAALCKELQVLGIEVAVVKPTFNQEPKYYFYEGVQVLEYLETSRPEEVLHGLLPPKGLNNFKNLTRQQKPDLIHFHESSGSNGITAFHLLAAKEMLIPVCTTFHLSGNICMRDDFLFKGKYRCDGIINTYKCSVCMLNKKGLPLAVPELLSFIGTTVKKEILLSKIGKVFNYPAYVKKHKERLLNVSSSSDKIFVLSNWFKLLLVKNGLESSKIVVLPSVIPSTEKVSVEKKKPISENRKIRLVYVGRITRIKGLHILIEAVLNLKQKNWELDIYGAISEDDYSQFCKSQTQGHRSINWKGVLLHNDVIRTLTNYDALIFPSIIQETMGMVMLEAFAANLPVIASSIWSVNEHIKDGENGLIFKTGSSFDLKRVLEHLLLDPSLLEKMSKHITRPEYMKEAAKVMFSSYRAILNYK